MAKYKKQFKIAVPECSIKYLSKAIENEPPTFEFEIESFYGIIYDISSNLSKSSKLMTPLSSKILQQKYGEGYRDMLDYLTDKHIIIESRHFTEGNCRKFGFPNSDKELKKMLTVLIDLNTSFGRYVKNRHNKEQKTAKWKAEHIKILRKEFYDMKFDTDLAIEELNSIKESLTNEQYMAIYGDILSLSKGNSIQRFFGRNETNYRIDSNITSLKSYFKKFIIDTYQLYQLDLKNSQPVLFNIILNLIIKVINLEVDVNSSTSTLFYGDKVLKRLVIESGKGFEKNQKLVGVLINEIEEYRLHTSNGTWYEHLSEVYNLYYETNYFDRDRAKSMWMALAYSSNHSKNYNVVKKAFEEKYPCIGKIMRKFKNTKHSELAVILQKIESNIFIDQISLELIGNNIVPITIHDSIIIKESQQVESQIIMNNVLARNLGFTPIIQVENLNDLEFKPKYTPLDIADEVQQLHLIRNARRLKKSCI